MLLLSLRFESSKINAAVLIFFVRWKLIEKGKVCAPQNSKNPANRLLSQKRSQHNFRPHFILTE